MFCKDLMGKLTTHQKSIVKLNITITNLAEFEHCSCLLQLMVRRVPSSLHKLFPYSVIVILHPSIFYVRCCLNTNTSSTAYGLRTCFFFTYMHPFKNHLCSPPSFLIQSENSKSNALFNNKFKKIKFFLKIKKYFRVA